MGRNLRLFPFAVALSAFGAALAAACGGSDTIPEEDGGADAATADGSSEDAQTQDGTLLDAGADAALDGTLPDGSGGEDAGPDARDGGSDAEELDGAVADGGSDADAGETLDAGGSDAEGVLDASKDADESDAHDAEADAEADADAEVPDAGDAGEAGIGPCAIAPVLGTAANFAVLAGTTVTSTGFTVVTGSLGVWSGSAVTGFGPGVVVDGAIHAGDATAQQAQSDLTVAYNDAAIRKLCAVTVSGDLGGMTLPPGIYTSATSLEISSGSLTLDAQGDPSAVFIFQMGTTLMTSPGLNVILSGGAQADNVYWQVGTSVTLGTTSVLYGNILAHVSITLDTGAALNGRALASTGAVTLDGNEVLSPPYGSLNPDGGLGDAEVPDAADAGDAD